MARYCITVPGTCQLQFEAANDRQAWTMGRVHVLGFVKPKGKGPQATLSKVVTTGVPDLYDHGRMAWEIR